MTEAQLGRLVELWAPRLGLDHYDIKLVVQALDDADSKAECQPSSTYRFARIVFQPWMVGQGQPPEGIEPEEISDDGVEKTLVHELLHVAVVPLKRTWKGFEEQVHPDAWSLFENQISAAEEGLVDSLAVALTAAWPEAA